MKKSVIHTGLAEMLSIVFPDNSAGMNHYNRHAELDTHPFGLEYRLPIRWLSDNNHEGRVHLIDYPGHTNPCVTGMARLLIDQLTSENRTFRLRIIRAQIDQEEHDLFFELINTMGSYIAGGCNDYSGAGGYGGEQLTAIFKAVSEVAWVAIEEVVISKGGRALTDALCAMYDKHTEELEVT